MIINIQTYQDKYDRAYASYNMKVGERNNLQKSIEADETRLTDKKGLVDLYNKTSMLLQQVGNYNRDHVKGTIESLVTYALATIFDDKGLSFRINFEVKRNSVEASFAVYDEALKQELDLIHGKGGGIVTVVSVALRIILIELCHPKSEGPIILDEVGKDIFDGYQEQFGKFLKEISQRLNRQIILNTHREKILVNADRVVKIVQDKKGESKNE